MGAKEGVEKEEAQSLLEQELLQLFIYFLDFENLIRSMRMPDNCVQVPSKSETSIIVAVHLAFT